MDRVRLIDEAWHAKHKLNSKISSTDLDTIYDLAKDSGAVGGKPLDAAANFIFFVHPFGTIR